MAADSLCTEDSIGRCAWNADAEAKRRKAKMNIYDLPYSRRESHPDWGRMWLHTGVLFAGGEKLIDDHTLVALTIMIAESKPEEKDMMITVIMNCLKP